MQKAQLAKKGYYMLEDGSKSTDPANSHLLKVKKAKKNKAASTAKPAAALSLESSEEESKQASPVKPQRIPKKRKVEADQEQEAAKATEVKVGKIKIPKGSKK